MPVVIQAEFQRATERAILVHYNNSPMWLPRSQIEIVGSNGEDWFDDLVRGGAYAIRLTNWIAQQKNITAEPEVNEEAFAAGPAHGGTVSLFPAFPVVAADDSVVCWCDNQRAAQMIAAALILTEGKV